jgi:hypothetical protein
MQLFKLKQDAKKHLRTAKKRKGAIENPKYPQTAKSTTMKRDRAFCFIRTLASSYFGGPSLANYRRRNVVSPLSSGWMSVGPTCHRHQECY